MSEPDQDGVAPIDVSVAESGSATVVHLIGELDASNADQLQERLAPVFEASPEKLVFDLSQLRFLDTTGIGLILRSFKSAGSVAVRSPSNLVREVLVRMGLSDVLRLET